MREMTWKETVGILKQCFLISPHGTIGNGPLCTSDTANEWGCMKPRWLVEGSGCPGPWHTMSEINISAQWHRTCGVGEETQFSSTLLGSWQIPPHPTPPRDKRHTNRRKTTRSLTCTSPRPTGKIQEKLVTLWNGPRHYLQCHFQLKTKYVGVGAGQLWEVTR